ncbi:hypothetical protein F3Y22_tig00110733pilonHSYRG00395 [Hibiscus syriacus]|uniref:Uncharacterized protein n=1 Tax=Hibiscus syriacus TaxID=106335 RepID=A0A6A2ZUT8_HIBSY|nr:uncharacterized protein LOC120139270 [Hibiscus syriacus]KAE8695187.1 hypothetical protein F3Y22_tig00110733pilonHSYRG00395 [Hibiscus syriacus]
MGACASSTSNSKSEKAGGGGARGSWTAAKVVDMNGGVQELKQPIQAKKIISQNPNCFLCSSESMSIGTCVPQVPDDEELQPGKIYFLMPLSHSHIPLSLPDLCALAIKASSATYTVDLCSTNSNPFELCM